MATNRIIGKGSNKFERFIETNGRGRIHFNRLCPVCGNRLEKRGYCNYCDWGTIYVPLDTYNKLIPK